MEDNSRDLVQEELTQEELAIQALLKGESSEPIGVDCLLGALRNPADAGYAIPVVPYIEDMDMTNSMKAIAIKTFIWRNTYKLTLSVIETLLKDFFDYKLVAIPYEIEDCVDYAYDMMMKFTDEKREYDLEMDSFTKYWLCSYLHDMLEVISYHNTGVMIPSFIDMLLLTTERDTEALEELESRGREFNRSDLLFTNMDEGIFDEEYKPVLGFSISVSEKEPKLYDLDFKTVLKKEERNLSVDVVQKTVEFEFMKMLRNYLVRNDNREAE